MEFVLNHKLKKGETEKVPLPNLKAEGLVPKKIKFSISELEFTLYSQNNSLFKYTEPYFRVYNEIDLSSFGNVVAEGQDLVMGIRNLSKKELELGISVVYGQHKGNIIYSSTFNYEQLLETCLKDIQDNGQITQLIIDTEHPVTSVILDPIYKLTKVEDGTDQDLINNLSNWTSALAIQNEKPCKRVMIDFTDSDLKSYVKYLKYYRLKIVFVEDKEKKEVHKTHLIAYGFK